MHPGTSTPSAIIDPTVGPFSSAQELEAWLTELRAMEDAPEVRQAVTQAERWLADRVTR